MDKKKTITIEIKKFLRIVALYKSRARIEAKFELRMNNIFKQQAKKFWELERKKSWLDKCYLQAQKDLSEIKKMGMSENPKDRMKFVSDLTEEWYKEIDGEDVLQKTLKDSYKEGYDSSGQEVLNEFKIDSKFDLRDKTILGSLDNRANLTKEQIDDTSWELVKNTIADGFWKEGKNPEKVADDIRGLFEETYKGRAENIARTETGQIVSDAQMETYKRMGIPEKEWLAEPTACELCFPLDGQIVAVEENFDNGLGWVGMNPLVHPSCMCAVTARVPDEYEPSKSWTGEE